VNPAFKHLDAKLRVADLTVRQWLGIFAGVMTAFVYAAFLHPFGTMATLVTAVYIAGVPIAAVLVAGFSEFDVWLMLRSAVRWRSEDERYLPGPGVPTSGYRVDAPIDDGWYATQAQLAELDPADLWAAR
jgi:hypothetical protein